MKIKKKRRQSCYRTTEELADGFAELTKARPLYGHGALHRMVDRLGIPLLLAEFQRQGKDLDDALSRLFAEDGLSGDE